MLNNLKLIIMSVILVVVLTTCKAEVPNNQAADSLKTEDQKQVEWLTDYQKALDIAVEYDKLILVNFTGSDWCIWCKRLQKEVFTQKAFLEYAQSNLVLLKLDFPKSIPQPPLEKKQNEALAQQFKIEGFPTILILNKEGKEIARTGYQDGGVEKYVAHLESIIK